MGARPLKETKAEGWSFEDDKNSLRRHQLPSTHFYSVSVASDPESPAWDEPGYIDPDWHHANLPDGARYWQGFAKPSRYLQRGEERPLSPEFVARVTHCFYPHEAEVNLEIDPHWDRRIRGKERNIWNG